MTEFTVVVGTARGRFEDIEEAKGEARRLYRLNAPDPVTVLDENGKAVFEIIDTVHEEEMAADDT